MASLADLLTYSQNLARKYTSLDTPKDQTLGETVGDIGLGFVPVVGTAQGARDFERARRENDWLGMGLSAASMIPVAGGVVKAGEKVAKQASKSKELAKALEKMPRMSKAEGEVLGLYHDIGGGVKLAKPVSEMTSLHIANPDLPLTASKIITPESMVGGYAIPFVGDRARTGTLLTNVEGKPLTSSVALEGGPDYMLAHTSPEAGKSGIWASDTGVISRLHSLAQNLGKNEKPVYGVYSAMSPTSVDFNTMLSEATIKQFDPSNFTKKQIKEFNEAVRTFPVKNQKTGEITYPGSHFVGVESPNALEQLTKAGEGGLRKTFVDRMNTAKFQNMGFPDIPATRAAITEPELLNAPLGQSGRAISQINVGSGINPNPAVPHKTYNTQLMGDYVGGLGQQVPSEIMFPNFYGNRRKLGKSPSSDWRAFSLSNVAQPLDQEWLDQLMNYVEKTKAGK
jgi:hypothetical protein